MNKFITYYRLARDELRKVIFPSKEQRRNAFISVFLVVVVVGIFLAIVDFLLSMIASSVL
ncbi:MAG: preprotein translocase subunit SecE [Helicobacter sp.]|nr:preprotein translocase subunit SecE [Helicobacter sp.]